uniref:ECSIT N-terminal domain-containing protein n=1 Tax=Timema douglasi TaxID=61478 RepID=A0A7R8ZDE3_TIMDO|nr:unnamed protein product [Timema douglasi]
MYIDAILRAKSVRWSQCKLASSAGNNDKSVVVRDLFEQVTDKNKQTYLDMVKIFESRGIHRRGHVEFIYSAMRHMEEFGVEKELEVYKALIDVLPKGRFIPTNIFQAEFMHYPKQQQCVIDVLEKMENNGVIPDLEMEDILVNIFGRKGHPVRKYWRMMYWMPKFKNISPWPLPRPVPQDSQLLARLALSRMSSVDLQTSVCTYQTSAHADSLDDTWVVSAQSPLQRKLLDAHPHNIPVYVEGAFLVWLREAPMSRPCETPSQRRERGSASLQQYTSRTTVPSWRCAPPVRPVETLCCPGCAYWREMATPPWDTCLSCLNCGRHSENWQRWRRIRQGYKPQGPRALSTRVRLTWIRWIEWRGCSTWDGLT